MKRKAICCILSLFLGGAGIGIGVNHHVQSHEANNQITITDGVEDDKIVGDSTEDVSTVEKGNTALDQADSTENNIEESSKGEVSNQGATVIGSAGSDKVQSIINSSCNTTTNTTNNSRPTTGGQSSNTNKKPNTNNNIHNSVANNNNNGGNTTSSTGNQQVSSTYLARVEDEIFNATNAERTKAGLKPFSRNITANSYARSKSLDMLTNNYFDHNSPTKGYIWDIAAKDGWRYSKIGENIYTSTGYSKDSITGNSIVNSWMNSSGHRANILNPEFTDIGIGVTYKDGKLYATQVFYTP